MYAVFMFLPMYDSHDVLRGHRGMIVPNLPVYETPGLAVRKAAQFNLEDEDEDIYFCALDVASYRPAMPAPAPQYDDGSEDIPF